jgi:hypothetical protein
MMVTHFKHIPIFFKSWSDIEQRYGSDRTAVDFDPKFPCNPGRTIGYVDFRRVLYNMVKTHMSHGSSIFPTLRMKIAFCPRLST